MTWAQIRDDAIAAFELADTGDEIPHTYAYAVGAIARQTAWTDSRVGMYLAKLYTLRNPDGGWGLGYAYDAFQNGTTNPATTTYTVTLADHVGLVLLDACAYGLAPVSDVQTIVDLLVTTNSAQYGASSGNLGRCIAYSRAAADNTVPAGCVHNASAAAAGFLWRARKVGITTPAVPLLAANVTKKEAVDWKWQTRWWPYIGTGADGDTDHTAAEAWVLWDLLPALAYETGRKILTSWPAVKDTPKAAIAIVRLATLCPEFADLAEPLMGEVAALVSNPPMDRNVPGALTPCRVLMQVAYWASQVA